MPKFLERITPATRPVLHLVVICGLAGFVGTSVSEADILTVQLMQLSGGTATSGTQTFITAALRVSGSLVSPLNTSAFGSTLTWTASGTGVTNSNLYTVNTAGEPTIGSAAMSVNSPGFLYADGVGTPGRAMNVIGLDPTNQRYVGVDADTSYYPTLSGIFTDVTIATLRFAVTDGITNAQFNFVLDGSAPNYGFFNSSFDAVSFANGGGTLVVVPEPDLPAGFLAVGIATISWRTRRRWLARRS